MSSPSLVSVVSKFLDDYTNNTPNKLKIIDAYLTYIFFTGVFQVEWDLLVILLLSR